MTNSDTGSGERQDQAQSEDGNDTGRTQVMFSSSGGKLDDDREAEVEFSIGDQTEDYGDDENEWEGED